MYEYVTSLIGWLYIQDNLKHMFVSLHLISINPVPKGQGA